MPTLWPKRAPRNFNLCAFYWLACVIIQNDPGKRRTFITNQCFWKYYKTNECNAKSNKDQQQEFIKRKHFNPLHKLNANPSFLVRRVGFSVARDQSGRKANAMRL